MSDNGAKPEGEPAYDQEAGAPPPRTSEQEGDPQGGGGSPTLPRSTVPPCGDPDCKADSHKTWRYGIRKAKVVVTGRDQWWIYEVATDQIRAVFDSEPAAFRLLQKLNEDAAATRASGTPPGPRLNRWVRLWKLGAVLICGWAFYDAIVEWTRYETEGDVDP